MKERKLFYGEVTLDLTVETERDFKEVEGWLELMFCNIEILTDSFKLKADVVDVVKTKWEDITED